VFSAARTAGVGECGAVMGVAPVAGLVTRAATTTLAVRAAAAANAPLDTFTLSSPCRVVTVFIDAHVYQRGGAPVNMLSLNRTRRLPRGGVFVLVVAVLYGLTACASGQVTPGPTGPSGSGGPGASTGPAALPVITIQRTGGFAG